MQNLAPGTIVDRKYKIEKLLGEGGMGVVWLCRDVVTEIPVVLKAIRSEFTHIKDYRDRILAEGRALARIDHPNVVRLNAVVAEENEVYLVMQFIDGESLEARIEKNVATNKQFSLNEALSIFRQIVGGVSAAHAEGIIHRDLKPANVLIRAKDGAVKVTDFGIAKDESEAQAGQGKTIGVIGSVRYMAPEQCTGKKDLDKRVDIYALGILLFELLTGTRPFEAESNFELMTKHVTEPLPSLAARRSDIPQWLENIVRRCTEKKRENRFSSCEELLAQIPTDLESRPYSTVLAMPVMNAPHPTTVPAMPAVVDASSASMPNYPAQGTHTAPAAVITAPHLPPPPGPNSPSRAPMVIVTIVASIALGLGASYSLGWFGKPSAPAQSGQNTPSTTAEEPRPEPIKPAASPAPKNPLEALVGPWKSSTGREYNAVLVNNTIEMRIVDVKPFAIQGYEKDEARFILRSAPGKTDRFLVEDRLRPNVLAGREYDIARSRLTCLVPFTDIDGKPLEARLENGNLYVNMVVILPEEANYTVDGKFVTGCKNLLTSKVSPIESTLGRP
jgi:eukaryotic-like serine/threonine-protein kinase